MSDNTIAQYLGFFSNSNTTYYLDNIILKEVTDSVFVIRHSWQMLIVCDNEYFDPAGTYCDPDYIPDSAPARCSGPNATYEKDRNLLPIMLGCEAYKDSSGTTLYLKSFDHLCREEAVGCEIFIDTYNSSTPFEKVWHQGEASEIIVPEDQTALMVNDTSKYCDSKDKGCLGVGKSVIGQNDEITSYQTVYYKNNPDKYDTIMCLASEVGCNEYTAGSSSYYFKDPGNKVCDYKAVAGTNRKSWYKRGTDDQCPVTNSQLGIEYPVGACITNQVGLACAPEAPNAVCNDDYTHCSGTKGTCVVPAGYIAKDSEPKECAPNLPCGNLAVYQDSNNDQIADKDAAGNDIETSKPGTCEGYKPGVCVGNSCLDNSGCQQIVNNAPTAATANNYCTNWVGICPANQNACTEFIDPVSPYAKNLIFNGGFEQAVANSQVPDGWKSLNGGLKIYGGTDGRFNSHGVKTIFNGFSTSSSSTKAVFYQPNVLIEPNTLYTLSAYVKKGINSQPVVIGLYGCKTNGLTAPEGVNSPDGSMIVKNVPSTTTPGIDLYIMIDNPRLSSDEYRLFSARFFSGDIYRCEGLSFGVFLPGTGLSATDDGHWFDEVSLRKTGVYYRLNNQKLDKTSCNGQVDFAKGCVLFNNRGAINWQAGEGDNRYLVFDSDQSPNKNGAPMPACDKSPVFSGLKLDYNEYSELCDSNLLLKVTPDRVCNEWLYCQSSIAMVNDAGEKENMCFDVGLCNSVDEQGKCDGQPLLDLNNKGNQTYGRGEADIIRNLSGYSKVGFTWDSAKGEKIEGFYPVYQMSQTGNLTEVTNGDFEMAEATGQPAGWNQEGDTYETDGVNESINWDSAYFKVVDDPIEAEDNGVCYKSTSPCLAPQGKNFMKVNGIYQATSEFINVFDKAEYVISAYVNSHWLSDGVSGILIFEYTGEGYGYCVPNTPAGYVLDWENMNPAPTPCKTDDTCTAGYVCKNWKNIIPFYPSIIEAGQNWEFKVFKFKTGQKNPPRLGVDANNKNKLVKTSTTDPVSKIKLKLLNYKPDSQATDGVIKNKAVGSSYFDDIQIKSALQIQDISEAAPECYDADKKEQGICQYKEINSVWGWVCSNNVNQVCVPTWHTTRDCRLYPEVSSVSCNYTDDKGAMRKGWQGYCLEYDRPPGNTDTCLLWWPVDVIQGEYWGAGFGYNDRYPLYYCLAAKESYQPGGFCANNQIIWAPNRMDEGRYIDNDYTGFAGCGGGLLGGDGGYAIVDFGEGFVDGAGDHNDPIGPNAPPSEYQGKANDDRRFDVSIILGCYSDKESTEVFVSNNQKDWVSLGSVVSGSYQCGEGAEGGATGHFEGACCPNPNDEEGCSGSTYRCGWQWNDDNKSLRYLFDLRGTAAEGGHFRYVKLQTKWSN